MGLAEAVLSITRGSMRAMRLAHFLAILPTPLMEAPLALASFTGLPVVAICATKPTFQIHAFAIARAPVAQARFFSR